MNKNWPQENLGNILTRRKDEVLVQELDSYKRLTIRMNGLGVVLRDIVEGSRIGTKHQFVTKKGQLLLSKIDARNGAFGVLPEECDGAIITGNFWAFDIDANRLDVRYLNYLTKTRLFVDFCVRASEGTTNRRYLQEPKFLGQRVSLPPLSEQGRIVARIEELSAKIEQTQKLRREAAEDAEAIASAAMYIIFDFENSETTVGDFAKVQGGFAFASDNYFEQGTHQVVRIGNVRDGYLDLSRAPVHWNASGDTRVLKYELRPDDIVISMTGTREKRDYGFIAKVPENARLLLNQRVGRFVVYREVDRNYLFHFLRSPFFRDRLFPSATGTANQANIGNSDIEKIRRAPPPIPEQRRIVAYLDDLQSKVDSVKKLQKESEVELNALMPSILSKAFAGEL